MKTIKISLISALLVIFTFGLSASAASVPVTQTQVGFTPATVTTTINDQIDRKIPTGQTAYQIAAIASKKADGHQLTGWLATTATKGRLPQTNEFSEIQLIILGSMLLLVAVLVGALYRLLNGEAEKRAH